MTTLRVELPDDLAEFVARSAGADLSSPQAQDYVLAVIEQERRRHEQLLAELRKGLASGISDRTIDEIWQDAVEQAKSRAA